MTSLYSLFFSANGDITDDGGLISFDSILIPTYEANSSLNYYYKINF